MPITPLHFGALAPINQFAPGRVSALSFFLVNIWIDSQAIISWITNKPLPSHDESNHTLVGAVLIAVLVSVVGMRSRKWVLGAFFGAISHILLDSLVHPEMNPFHPDLCNPLYMGWMTPLSIVLLPLTVWFIAQCVSSSLGWLKRRQEPVPVQHPKPDA